MAAEQSNHHEQEKDSGIPSDAITTETDSATTNAERLWFLDNVRTIMVLIVVIWHVVLPYGFHTPLRVVDDGPYLRFADWFGFITDVFQMPVLFFIAGHFGLPSLNRDGFVRFLLRKTRRLLLPGLLVAALFNPITMYVVFSTNGFDLFPSDANTVNYWIFWREFLRGIVEFPIGQPLGNSTFFLIQVWFVTLLFLFFVALAVFNAIRPLATRQLGAHTEDPATTNAIIRTLVWFHLISWIAIAVVVAKWPVEQWVAVGPFIQFQAPNVLLDVSYFILGIMSYRSRWFDRKSPFGPLLPWFVALVLVTVPYVGLQEWAGGQRHVFESSSFAASIWFLRVAVCFLFLVISLGVAQKYLNRPTRLNRLLSKTSYGVYLVHLPIVALLQYLLFLSWEEGPTAVKVVFISIVSVVLSQLIAAMIPNWVTGETRRSVVSGRKRS